MQKRAHCQHLSSAGMTYKLERCYKATNHLPDFSPNKYSVATAFLRRFSMRRIQAGQTTLTHHLDDFHRLTPTQTTPY